MRNESVSVIIPSHNEGYRIKDTVATVRAYLSNNFTDHEIIVVDSASTDDTGKKLEEISKTDGPIRTIKAELPGKGLAVRTGIFASLKDFVMFTDADLSAPISELSKLLDALLTTDSSVAIGSRKVAGANIVKRQPVIRKIMSLAVNVMIRLLFGLNISDTQCGFKMFKRKAANDIFNEQKIDGYLFDVEVLYLAKKKGYKIKEVPITWGHNPGGRVNFFKEIYRVPRDLIKIKMLHR